jgi:hypothetical protein
MPISRTDDDETPKDFFIRYPNREQSGRFIDKCFGELHEAVNIDKIGG